MPFKLSNYLQKLSAIFANVETTIYSIGIVKEIREAPSMNEKISHSASIKGFFWALFFLACSSGWSVIPRLFLIDFVHDNPNRTRQNALFMMATDPFMMMISEHGITE